MTATNKREIQEFLHCALCLSEATKAGIPPKDYQQLEVGWTPAGLQVWCKRHNANVIHIDFEGRQHPADTTRAKSILEN